jgi:F420 biosynthesis protein FbiB-like protein
MKLIEGLETRRSIRTYKKDPVEMDKIKKILNLAILAPSAHNSNPWNFVVIDNDQIKRKLAVEMAEKYRGDLQEDGIKQKTINNMISESINRFSTAPILIIPCLNMEKMQKYPDKKRQKNEWIMGIESVSAAIQNTLLAAHALGLSSCWHCAPLFAKKIVRRVLKIPESIEPIALITVGYSLTDKSIYAPHRPDLSELCFLNSWGAEI